MKPISTLTLTGLIAAVSLVSLAAPATASATQFYIKHELFEEFKPISSTVEAKVESNGALEWYFPLYNIQVLCHAEGREKLFTGGTDELIGFSVDTCVSGGCLVGASVYEGPDDTVLGEFGSPVTYTDNLSAGPEATFTLSGSGCARPGTYIFFPFPFEECEDTVDNAIDLELVFPVAGKKERGCHGFGYGGSRMSGRLRVVPLEGRALKVGP
jgi:hypothetical protein